MRVLGQTRAKRLTQSALFLVWLVLKACLHVRCKDEHKKPTCKPGQRKHKIRKLFLFLCLCLCRCVTCVNQDKPSTSTKKQSSSFSNLQACFLKIFNKILFNVIESHFYFIPEPHQFMKLALLFPFTKGFPYPNPFWLLFYCSFSSH